MSTATPVLLTDCELETLSRFITGECGIKMPASKKSLIESRLQKRLRGLGMDTFKQYCEYLLSEDGRKRELPHCIDAITTNKTDFFRESSHFTYLTDTVVPALLKASRGMSGGCLNFWSAGCSTGEEPYTLAIVLSELAQTQAGLDFSILATDISTRVLETASLGVYDREGIAPIPERLRQRYLLQSRNPEQRVIRIVPELRQKVEFRRLNLMDEPFNLRKKFHVIFCRNVLIYFDRPTQETLLMKFCQQLLPEGFLFLGHSETINAMELPLVSVASTVYQLR